MRQYYYSMNLHNKYTSELNIHCILFGINNIKKY